MSRNPGIVTGKKPCNRKRKAHDRNEDDGMGFSLHSLKNRVFSMKRKGREKSRTAHANFLTGGNSFLGGYDVQAAKAD